MPNQSQEPQACSKNTKSGLKGHVSSLHLHNQLRIKTSMYLRIVNSKIKISKLTPQSGTSNILQCLKTGLKGNRCSLNLKNQVYQRPATISTSKSRYPSPGRNHWVLQSPKSGHKGQAYYMCLQNQFGQLKSAAWGFQRPVTQCKSKSGFHSGTFGINIDYNSFVKKKYIHCDTIIIY